MAHADIRVGVEQVVSLVGGQSVPDTKPALLEGFEHYFERFALVEMDEDFEAALPEGLDARDERVSRAQTLVDDAHVFHPVARIELRSLCHRGALRWLGTTLQKYLSTSLRVPIFFEQVVVEGDVATVVENDHAVFS